MSKKEINKESEQILNLAREEKVAEEELLRQSIEDKNKIIEELKNTNTELNKQNLYLKAEFENYRKRVEKEKQQKFILGKINVFEKIIHIYEIFKYAVENLNNLQNSNEAKNILEVIEGVKLLHKEFENFLQKEGIKRIECVNEIFNPIYHEVLEFEETENIEDDNKIKSIISEGYIWKDDSTEYVLKPARVKITKYKSSKNFETNKDSETSNKIEEEK